MSSGAYGSVPYNNPNTRPAGYPYPPHSGFDNSSSSFEGRNSFQEHDTTPLKPEFKDGAVRVDMRQISRTPSPTPSEAAELQKKGIFDWKAMKNWRYWFRKEWFCAFAMPLLPLCFY